MNLLCIIDWWHLWQKVRKKTYSLPENKNINNYFAYPDHFNNLYCGLF